MKRALAWLIVLCSVVRGDFPQWPQPDNLPFVYHPFEHRIEANNHIVIYGDSTYGTSIRLDGSKVYSGDSSVVGFVLKANDSDNQSSHGYLPHRAYIFDEFYGYPLIDTTRYQGVPMQCPCFIEFAYLEVGINLHGRGRDSLGHKKIDDWESPGTVTPDSTHINPTPVTIGRDSDNYLYIEHAPQFDTTIHIYQAAAANDPTGAKRLTPNRWHLIQWYYDPIAYGDSGYSKVWSDFNLESWNTVRHQPGFISAVHLGLYCSAAVASGSVYNDNEMIVRVHNEQEAVFLYMTGRRLGYKLWARPPPQQWYFWPRGYQGKIAISFSRVSGIRIRKSFSNLLFNPNTTTISIN